MKKQKGPPKQRAAIMKLPTTGRPTDVLDNLARFVSETIGQKSVAKFYIGRTGDLDSAISRHKCDNIVTLFKAEKIQNVIKVESSLIELLIEDDKCANGKQRSVKERSGKPASYVYLAIWYDLSAISR